MALFSLPAFAARGGVKGADQKAYEHTSDNAIFNRVSDWFATRGKSEEEKQAIIAERKAKRAQKQAEKETERTKKKLEREARKAKKEAEKKAKELKKKIKDTGDID